VAESLSGSPEKAAEAPATAVVRQFIDRLKAATAENTRPSQKGGDIRLSAPGLVGGALVSGGRVVHLAAFEVVEAARA